MATSITLNFTNDVDLTELVDAIAFKYGWISGGSMGTKGQFAKQNIINYCKGIVKEVRLINKRKQADTDVDAMPEPQIT